MLPAAAIASAEDAARACDLMIVAGTSAEVYPAAALPSLAKAAGATLCEVNPHATPVSSIADFALRARSGDALPALVAAAWPQSFPAGGGASSGLDDGGGAK